MGYYNIIQKAKAQATNSDAKKVSCQPVLQKINIEGTLNLRKKNCLHSYLNTKYILQKTREMQLL
jgi:hypothetical protein